MLKLFGHVFRLNENITPQKVGDFDIIYFQYITLTMYNQSKGLLKVGELVLYGLLIDKPR
jgi:hypothetical protein